jgi:hypothetical protein
MLSGAEILNLHRTHFMNCMWLPGPSIHNPILVLIVNKCVTRRPLLSYEDSREGRDNQSKIMAGHQGHGALAD